MQKSVCLVTVCFAVLLLGSGVAWSQVLIDQTKALNGNVTAGDAAGFPVTISQPGSYRLTGNLTVTNVNTIAILITTTDVTLDLNGFRIKGPVTCAAPPTGCNNNGTGTGVSAGSRQNITVLNGTVRGMGGDGIQVGARSRIERVQVVSNGGFGITVGNDSVVSDNTVTLNGAPGIQAAEGGTISGNRVTLNASDGILAGVGSIVTGNVSRSNAGTGIFSETHVTLSGNTLTGNSGDGVFASGSMVFGNTSALNQGSGVNAGDGSVVSYNAVADNPGDPGLGATRGAVIGNAVTTSSVTTAINASRSMVLGNVAASQGFGVNLTRTGWGHNSVTGLSVTNSLGTDCNVRADLTPMVYTACPP